MYRQQQQADRSPRGGHGEKKKKKEETAEVQIFGWQHTDQEIAGDERMKRGQRRLLSRITRVRV